MLSLILTSALIVGGAYLAWGAGNVAWLLANGYSPNDGTDWLDAFLFWPIIEYDE